MNYELGIRKFNFPPVHLSTFSPFHLSILIFALCLFSFAITFAAPADTSKNLTSSVVDDANVLGEKNVQALTAKIKQVEQKHGVRIGVNFYQTIGNQNVDTTANHLLKKYFGDGQNGGIIFLVVMDTRSWNIALDAKMNQRIFSYTDVAYLNDGFMDKLHNDNFAGASDIFVKNVDELLTYYEQNGKPFDRAEQFNPMALGAAILIAIVLGFFVRSVLIGSMSNVRHAQEATDYLKRDTVRLTEQRDTYLFTNVSRRPKSSGNKNSGGGSRGGGGSSGGGHF